MKITATTHTLAIRGATPAELRAALQGMILAAGNAATVAQALAHHGAPAYKPATKTAAPAAN